MSDPVTKRCTKCGETKPVSEYGRDSKAPDGLFFWCHVCARESGRRYREAHREIMRERDRDRYRKNHEAQIERARQYRKANREAMRERASQHKVTLREQVFAHYGTTCACCGSVELLGIDHVNGDGRQHREELFGVQSGGVRFYRWLVKQGFPAGYQVLCRGCNVSKGEGDQCRLDHSKGTA